LVIEYPKSFFPVILIVFLLRSFLVEPFKIPPDRWCRPWWWRFHPGQQVRLRNPDSAHQQKIVSIGNPSVAT